VRPWQEERISALERELRHNGVQSDDGRLPASLARLQVLGAERGDFLSVPEERQRALLHSFVRQHAALAIVLDWFGLDLAQDERGFFAGDRVGVVKASPAFGSVRELEGFCGLHLSQYEAICREGSTGPWFWQAA